MVAKTTKKKSEEITQILSIRDAIGTSVSIPTVYDKIQFPTDTWGLTTDIKAAGRHLAGRICGSEDKYTLVRDTLQILVQYLEDRYQADAAALKAKTKV